MTNAEQQRTDSLARATQNQSTANYSAIFAGFEAKGIDPEKIIPRVNVFSYKAWQKLGRQVRKGEKGVKVLTWIPSTKKDKKTGKKKSAMMPKNAHVFHISQTDEKSN